MHKKNLHYTPKNNWMNDPNGLVYYKEEYHLFYQYNPNDTVWGPMYWGHAVSKDLISWEELPIALEPDQLGDIFSGSIVYDTKNTSKLFKDENGLVAIFTHHNSKEEIQSIAHSVDSGRTWSKYSNNPVIKNPGNKDFRDPKVFWHEETKKWVSVLSYATKVMIYSSKDLINWIFESDFHNEKLSQLGIIECPDLIQLNVANKENCKKWILKMDVQTCAYAGGSGALYYVGSFDGETFTCDSSTMDYKWVDYGQDFYASQSWSNVFESQNRQIWIAWMNNWDYANKIPANNYRGMMSIPKEIELLYMNEEYHLIQKPVKELDERKVELAKNNELRKLKKDLYEICNDVQAVELNLEIEDNKTSNCDIKLSYGNNQYIVLNYSGENKIFTLDRSFSSNTSFSEKFKGVMSGKVISIGDYLSLKVILDRNSIEVFINNGLVNLSALVFPNESINQIEILALNDELSTKNLEIFSLTT